MKSQEFYQSFKQRKKDDHNFFYGLERNEPISSLLFYRNSIGDNSHQFDHNLMENTFYFPDASCSEIEINGGNPSYTKSIKEMIFSAAELHFSRVSTYEFECSLCHHRCSYNDRVSHIVSYHSRFLSEIFEANCTAIDDDNDFLNGLMLKLQFDSILTTPTKGYPPACKESCICAPSIYNKESNFDNEEEELNSPTSKKIYDTNQKISIRVQGALNPVLTKFVNNHQPIPPVCETQVPQELLIPENRNDSPQSTNNVDENTTNNSPKQPSAAALQPSPKTTNPTFINFNPGSPSKSSPPKQQPISQQPITQQQTNQTASQNTNTKSTETKKKPSPSNTSTANTSVKINSNDTSYQSSQIPVALLEQLSINNPRNSTPPKNRTKLVPYFDLIPTSIRSQIISNLAREFIKSYVSTTTFQIVKPLLQTKKKAHQKKMREEKAKKAKNEEKMRIAAMRQRKDNAIQKMSNDMVTPIIRSFIRSEIEDIFNQESKAIKEASQNISKIEQNEEIVKAPPPVVLSGLMGRTLNPNFLREKFANFNFQLDENNEPKIRFRINNQRCEALLYLATFRDFQALCSQSPMQIEYANVTLTPETEDNSTPYVSYAGQELMIICASTLDNFEEDKGISSLVSMCPVMCLENNANLANQNGH